MINPFNSRAASLSGPARDIVPVIPSDTTDLTEAAIGLYVETGGTIVLNTVKGETRTIQATDFAILPVGTTRVLSTGTSASGIHALVLG